MNRIDAYIDDRHFGSNTVRILLIRPSALGQMSYIRNDGTWGEFAEAEHIPEDGGLIIPREAVKAIHEAIKQYGGSLTDDRTEVKVLREWLEVERSRVNRFLAMEQP